MASTEDGRTILELSGRLYDAQEYLSGQSLFERYPSSGPAPNVAVPLQGDRLSTLAEALAQFHRSTLHLPPDPDREVAPLPERLDGLATEMKLCHEVLLDGARERAGGKERETALRWLEVVPHALAVAREASGKSPGARDTRVLCHGDLWPAHVYFDGDDFVGFADFDSLVFAPSALDLAQLIGHFGGWGTRAVVLEAYERIAPLGERCREALQRELPLELVADLVGEGLWALYGQLSSETNPVQREAHVLNMSVLLGCLEDASEEVEALLG